MEEDQGEEDRPDQTITPQSSKGLIRRKRHVRRPSAQAETKYIELMVVNDYDLVGLSSPHPPLPLLKCVCVCLRLQACALHL